MPGYVSLVKVALKLWTRRGRSLAAAIRGTNAVRLKAASSVSVGGGRAKCRPIYGGCSSDDHTNVQADDRKILADM